MLRFFRCGSSVVVLCPRPLFLLRLVEPCDSPEEVLVGVLLVFPEVELDGGWGWSSSHSSPDFEDRRPRLARSSINRDILAPRRGLVLSVGVHIDDLFCSSATTRSLETKLRDRGRRAVMRKPTTRMARLALSPRSMESLLPNNHRPAFTQWTGHHCRGSPQTQNSWKMEVARVGCCRCPLRPTKSNCLGPMIHSFMPLQVSSPSHWSNH